MNLYIINTNITFDQAKYLLNHLRLYNGEACDIVEIKEMKDSNGQDIKSGYLDKLTIGRLHHRVYNWWKSTYIKQDRDDVIYYLVQTLQIVFEDIFEICRNNAYKCLKVLIDQGVSVNIQDSRGDTPLNEACCYNSVETVKLLLEQGANVNIQNNYGSTSLHYACYNNSFECVKLLIDNGARKDIQNINDNTPLHLACKCNRVEIAKLLILNNGANVNIQNNNGYTPLQIAQNNNSKDCIKLLQPL